MVPYCVEFFGHYWLPCPRTRLALFDAADLPLGWCRPADAWILGRFWCWVALFGACVPTATHKAMVSGCSVV